MFIENSIQITILLLLISVLLANFSRLTSYLVLQKWTFLNCWSRKFCPTNSVKAQHCNEKLYFKGDVLFVCRINHSFIALKCKYYSRFFGNLIGNILCFSKSIEWLNVGMNVWAETAENTERTACGWVREGSHKFSECTATGESEGEAQQCACKPTTKCLLCKFTPTNI